MNAEQSKKPSFDGTLAQQGMTGPSRESGPVLQRRQGVLDNIDERAFQTE